MKYTYEQLAKMIDHSLLHPTMTDEELEEYFAAPEAGGAEPVVQPLDAAAEPAGAADPEAGAPAGDDER